MEHIKKECMDRIIGLYKGYQYNERDIVSVKLLNSAVDHQGSVRLLNFLVACFKQSKTGSAELLSAETEAAVRSLQSQVPLKVWVNLVTTYGILMPVDEAS